MSESLEGKKVLVLGCGREGQSVLRYFLKYLAPTSLTVADQSERAATQELPGNPHTVFGEDYLKSASEYEVIVRSPGIPLNLPEIQSAKANGSILTSATNLFLDRAPCRVVGITGTKGKSTTTTLIGAMLSQHLPDVRVVGNIGIPALDQLESATPNTTFVMELSSYQLEDLQASPEIAVVLNVVPEHLDHHGSFPLYLEAKRQIVSSKRPCRLAITNPTYPSTAQMFTSSTAQMVRFATTPQPELQSWIEDATVMTLSDGIPTSVIPVAEIPLLGKANLENVLAATSCAAALGTPAQLIASAIRTFRPLEHRLEFVAKRHNVRYYNDSLATIPEALLHALEALGPDVETLIAGGFDRGLSFAQVGRAIAKSQIRNLILFPTTGKRIWAATRKALTNKVLGPTPFHVTSMEEAVLIAYQRTSSGKICLLSPASASFGVFRDYHDRGRSFKRCVEELDDGE